MYPLADSIRRIQMMGCFFRTKVLTNVKKYGIISYVVDKYADVAELADARDLKSRGKKFPYRFDPGHRHHQRVIYFCRSSFFTF